ncbi:MAG: ABC transporter permease [Chloroflexota bacterium]|nr:ABC transporter permease [Chloroflexota bacterium]
MLALTKIIQPNYGAPQLTGLAIAVLPVAFAAVAQAIVVISGGIDLSVASIMALTNVTAAVLMQDQGEGFAIAAVLGVLLLGVVVGATNGALIVVTRVPDIVVTLAMSFVWAGATLLVLSSPGGGAADWFKGLVNGSILVPWLPRAFVTLLVVVAIIWIPLRRSLLGMSLYAVGSDQLAAFRSGVSVGRTKIVAYALTGLFCAMGGLVITASTGSGSPLPGPYTLQSVAAIVLGGVSLAGGRGGVAGPIVAVAILQLVRTDLTLLGVNPQLSTAVQGAILISVVLVGSLLTLRRTRA